MSNNISYFHLAAFRSNIAAGTAYASLAGVPDNVLTRSSSSSAFLTPPGARIRLGLAGGTDITKARINAPSLRRVAFPNISPLNLTDAIKDPQSLIDYGPQGPSPTATDELLVEAIHSNVAAQDLWAVLALVFGRKEPAPGERFRIRATAAIAAVVATWQSGALTFEQQIPPGIYEINGMHAFGANLIAARLLFSGGGWRPGVFAVNDADNTPNSVFTNGTLGCFGQFDSVTPPQLEVFAEGANTAQEIMLDVTRLGDRY